MFYVYILQSLKDGSYYIGQTNGVSNRLERHNSRRQLATRSKVPWELVYTKPFPSKNSSNQTGTRDKKLEKSPSHQRVVE